MRIKADKEKQRDLEAIFGSYGIPLDKPGFYDHRNFLTQEKQDPCFLGKYAEYVLCREYDSEYLTSARAEIEALGGHLYDELLRDGRKGACVDLSGSFSRMLDELGVWNFPVKGSLTVTFDSETGLPRAYFPPIMSGRNRAVAGHCWVYAPPFVVVDLTLSAQPYTRNEALHLPSYVMLEELDGADLEVMDLMESEAQQIFVNSYGRFPSKQDLDRIDPGIFDRAKSLGLGKACIGKAQLKYASLGMGASDCSLNQITSLQLSGKYPAQVFQEYRANKP